MPETITPAPHWLPRMYSTFAAISSQSNAAPGLRTTSPPMTPPSNHGPARSPALGGNTFVAALSTAYRWYHPQNATTTATPSIATLPLSKVQYAYGHL